MFDSYCRLYTNTTLDKNELFNKIYAYTGGNISCINGITTSWGFISVTKNGCSDKTERSNRQLCVEAEIYNNVSEECYIKNINGLIEHMEDFCSGITPLCDFKNNLIYKHSAQ